MRACASLFSTRAAPETLHIQLWFAAAGTASVGEPDVDHVLPCLLSGLSGWWGGVAAGAQSEYQRLAYTFIKLASSKLVLDVDVFNPMAIDAPLHLLQMAGLDSEPWCVQQVVV